MSNRKSAAWMASIAFPAAVVVAAPTIAWGYILVGDASEEPRSTSALNTSISYQNSFYQPRSCAMTTSPSTLAALHEPAAQLDALDIVRIGVSIDVFRQEDVWKKMMYQNQVDHRSIHLKSILPDDVKAYPTDIDDKNSAYAKRKSDALEMALQGFPEAWEIPTMTVVRSWDRTARRLYIPEDTTKIMLSEMVDNLRQPAGLHWHRIKNMPDGEICDSTPEGVVEAVFQRFEENPDMPSLLVYVVDGVNMQSALSRSEDTILGLDAGPRVPGELTDAMVAIVFARPERMDWLRAFAPYTKVNGSPLYPGFSGWKRKPKQPFIPTPFIPQPWTVRGMEQWDQMKVLARIHRPVTVALLDPEKPGRRLRSEDLSAVMAKGWQQATMEITPQPSRVFFDGGSAHQPLADIMPALKVAGSRLDLLDSNESYDLMARLGDTGAASPFVGIALATMASYTNADTSVVMPMRRDDQATIFTITSATPGKPPKDNVFGVKLLPQTASSDVPSAAIVSKLVAEHRASAPEAPPIGPPWEEIEAARKAFDAWVAEYPES